MSLVQIIHEDADLLVVNKPAGLVCHPTKDGADSSLVGRVRLHLEQRAAVGGVPVHLVNRLDRETSGVVVIATNDAAARELRRIWEARLTHKEYLAIVHGHVGADHELVDAALGRDEHSRVAIKDCVRPDGAPAQTEFWVVRRFRRAEGDFSLLRVVPRSGRKHQIRIHLASVGHPVIGDKLYGGDEGMYLAFVTNWLTEEQRRRLILPCHALHAGRVQFDWRGKGWRFEVEPEEWFAEFAEVK